ncbi:hypothetical protein DL762_009598 [Monosporascus cannonballus]|uniref:Uncharacterized protein n=1 Tax=Monosporascus cannonballus TaxID=155416 RepID=A0ABY0GTL4_9PEZI|nr:hypothetical protein DL762_009598 [Monosporascus cannonballus]
MPRSNPHPPRSRTKPNLKFRSVRECTTIQCYSDKAYTCQSSLLILLNARFCCTLRLIHQSDSRRSIEVRRPRAARSIPFDDFLYRIGGRDPFPIQLGHLDTLEESLVAALRLLHAKGISFPVSAEQIELLRPLTSVPDSTAHPILFLPYNKRATWASDNLPPTWQADQLSDARLIFRIAKLLLRLSDLPSRPALLDLSSQHALATYLSRNPPSYHIDLCLGVAPVTAKLAYQIALALDLRNKGQESRDVLESFFGGPMPLPEPGQLARAPAVGLPRDETRDDAQPPVPVEKPDASNPMLERVMSVIPTRRSVIDLGPDRVGIDPYTPTMKMGPIASLTRRLVDHEPQLFQDFLNTIRSLHDFDLNALREDSGSYAPSPAGPWWCRSPGRASTSAGNEPAKAHGSTHGREEAIIIESMLKDVQDTLSSKRQTSSTS